MTRKLFLKSVFLTVVSLVSGIFAQTKIKKSVIHEASCVGCGDCIRTCPVKAISLKRGKAFINQDTCVGCKLCVQICSYGAPQ